MNTRTHAGWLVRIAARTLGEVKKSREVAATLIPTAAAPAGAVDANEPAARASAMSGATRRNGLRFTPTASARTPRAATNVHRSGRTSETAARGGGRTGWVTRPTGAGARAAIAANPRRAMAAQAA